jgi:hypothetical protein
VQRCVKQTADHLLLGPDPGRPHFRKRQMLPIPPDNSPRDAIDAAGFHPSFRGHNHSPALEVCPNGDLLLVIYTSYHEYEPEVSLIASRLRLGADEWDKPTRILDFPNANNHAPLLWNDGEVLHLFWGNPMLPSAFPFQWTSSRDSGATWDEVRFPRFTNEVGPHSRQPINTAFRGPGGKMYVASDAAGGTSVLWLSRDGGGTWEDPGGRSAGRHTTFVPLTDGDILGMGGKNTDLDGYMPEALSSDGGKTWRVSKTPFSSQGANQRPSVLRLQSGRLFFAGDFQRKDGFQPKGIAERGAYVALSEDEGRTWHTKKLVGAQPHENPKASEVMMGGTIGYSVARQAPNGVIHLITTMNHPCLHFEMNETWILTEADSTTDSDPMNSPSTQISNLRDYEESHPNGSIRARWRAGIADDGRHLLHGSEVWYHENGTKELEAEYALGRKVGKETYWSADGTRLWEWQHGDEGTGVWSQWWPDGSRKARSTWIGLRCDGPAMRWDYSGNLTHRAVFKEGRLVDQ